jgi:hypothetical protein
LPRMFWPLPLPTPSMYCSAMLRIARGFDVGHKAVEAVLKQAETSAAHCPN